MNTPQVTIYTDGGCWPNPGIGGWGALLLCKGHSKELCGGEAESTNNRMELLGPIFALEHLTKPCIVTLYSDSQYVVKGMNEWIAGWKVRGWTNSSGRPVANRELWERLETAAARHTTTFQWVKGHAGNEGNERADELSRRGAEQAVGRSINFERFTYAKAGSR